MPTGTHYRDWQIRDGKLFVDGTWVFLKIGKPLLNFADPAAVKALIDALGVLKTKNYNALELNCYWHHFDQNGDGVPDASTESLRRLVDAIYAAGMFPCISVETYGVGGGNVPEGFWKNHPDAVAINSEGKPVSDTEYGVFSSVPSILNPAYQDAARTYIRSIAAAVDTRKVLYFETTVEPQYIGNQSLSFDHAARTAFEAWLKDKGIEDAPAWPETLPVPDRFRKNRIWNQFRAEALADWINKDAEAYRSVAGQDAYIAVDYLETGGADMMNRNGDSRTFLMALTSPTIIQVNWHWHVGHDAPNQVAYDNVWRVIKETGRDWAVSEHMTFNGSDYTPRIAPRMLRNTIKQGTRFGWEFVSTTPSSQSNFSCYNDDWSAKPLIAVVDDHWEEWLAEIRAAEAAGTTAP